MAASNNRIGRFGLLPEWEAQARINRNQRLAWYFSYQRTTDPVQAEVSARAAVYPKAVEPQIPSLLSLLQRRHLTFAGASGPSDVLPFSGAPPAVFMGFHREDGGAMWMPGDSEILVFAAHSGWLNVEHIDKYVNRTGPATLEFACLDHRGELTMSSIPSGFSLPVEAPGQLSVRLKSPAGAVRPADVTNSTDVRDLSFRIRHVGVESSPTFVRFRPLADGSWLSGE